MKLEVYSVYDKGAAAFLQPVFVRARGEMLRSFDAACNSGDHQFAKHSGDYVLYFVGHWNDSSGEFEFDGTGPIKVISALEVVNRPTGSPGIAEQ